MRVLLSQLAILHPFLFGELVFLHGRADAIAFLYETPSIRSAMMAEARRGMSFFGS